MWPHSHHLRPLPVHNVVRMDIPTIGSTCAIPGHPPDSHQEEQKMATPGANISPAPDAEEEGTNIKARKVRKILTIITIKISQKPQQQQNLHYKQSAPMKTHIDTEEFVVEKFREIH